MKKIIFLVLFIASQNFFGQNLSKNALGLRLGDNDGFGAELSYQRSLSKDKRLEFDLGWRDSNHVDAFKLVGLHQWVWKIDGGFNWYAGLGAGLGSWSVDKKYGDYSGSYFLAAGDLGIEYNFDIPIQLSLDFRPEMYFGGGDGFDNFHDSFGPDVALGIRYKW